MQFCALISERQMPLQLFLPVIAGIFYNNENRNTLSIAREEERRSYLCMYEKLLRFLDDGEGWRTA
jgi:hypothetical protein